MPGKVGKALQIVSESGVTGLVGAISRKLGIPLPRNKKSVWRANVGEEIRWWDGYFQREVVPQRQDYPRLQADKPLQKQIVDLLPPGQETVDILDVGAGPLTFLGKVCPGRTLFITAVDPLARHYDRILAKHDITPLVRTEEAHAERLSDRFPPDTFDLVYARNCIDHSYDPEKAILEMVTVVKPDHHVLMEHHPNEAEHVNYVGLHQWNLSMDDSSHFILSSKNDRIDMTEKYRDICSITCEIVEDDEPWLVTRIHKKP